MDRRRQIERELDLLGVELPRRTNKRKHASGLLAPSDFRELEKLGSTSRRPIRFRPKARAVLNRLLGRLCAPEGEKLVPAELKTARTALSRIDRMAADLLGTFHKMRTDAAPGMRLAAQSLFPADDAKLSHTGAALGQPYGIEETSTLLRTIREGSKRAARALNAEPTERKRWDRFFIFAVVEAFEGAGGLARANYQDAKGEPDSPFLRVLCSINLRLPKNRRTPEKTLKERARRIIAERMKTQGETPAGARVLHPASQGRNRTMR
ncbi:MAG TPA: hypothetical protein VFY92_07060 [Hyphomicrobiaceae bacterium]|nr:hypothetical protein [Hyphomicrobiaceae bacterium]